MSYYESSIIRKPYTRYDIRRLAEQIAAQSKDPTRHKCFISYHADDADDVGDFIEEFGSEFLPRSVGVTAEDDFIDSDADDYVMRRIREKYLSDSTVTIVLLGDCTWARKFVDWEVASSLRNDEVNRRSGLLLYPLHENSAHLPARVRDNWNEGGRCYAYYRVFPDSKTTVRRDIEDAFAARIGKAHLVDNSRPLSKHNRSC